MDSSESSPSTPAPDEEFRALLPRVLPHTLLSEARLWSLFTLGREVCRAGVPGSFVECGVAAGGSSALLSYVVARYGGASGRRLYCFDSFAGLPRPAAVDRHEGRGAEELGWGEGTCAAPVTSLLALCRQLGTEAHVQPVPGLFEQTLPSWRAQVGPIALLHMDGDWYASTMTVWTQLYDQVSDGGRIQVDDYGYWEGCREATHAFFAQRRLQPELHTVDSCGVWLRKVAAR
jgi:O-methyltransferase